MLKAIEMLIGEIILFVSNIHKIRITLDNHSAHALREIRNFLAMVLTNQKDIVRVGESVL